MDIPAEGSNIQIQSYKHNGSIHRIWAETKVLKATNHMVIGGNDRTLVTEADGRTWITREPAICYFHADLWFNIISMIRDNGVYHYCNLGSPYVYDREALKYIDYDLDIKVFPDMTFTLLDEDEYEHNKKVMGYPDVIDHILKKNVDKLVRWIRQRVGPFSADFIDTWYDRYLTYLK